MEKSPKAKLFEGIITALASVIGSIAYLSQMELFLRWLIILVCVAVVSVILILHYIDEKDVRFLYAIIGVLSVVIIAVAIYISSMITTTQPPTPTPFNNIITPPPTTPPPTIPTTPPPTIPTTPPPTISTTPPPTIPTTPPPTPPSPTPLPLSMLVQNWSRTTGYDYLYFGHKQDQTPILWKVLGTNSSRAILLSDRIQLYKQYDNNNSVWEKSTLCNWLNVVYIEEAFYEDERLALTSMDGDAYITIPTRNDLINSNYGFSKAVTDINRIAKVESNLFGNTPNFSSENAYDTYFTRTPEQDKSVSVVDSEGTFHIKYVYRENIGIRPMICIDLDKLTYIEGDGSKDSPYVVAPV